MEFKLQDLTAAKLQSIFAAAYIDTRIDGDGDLVVTVDDLKIVVKPALDKDFLKFMAMAGPSTDKQKVMEFCNRYNNSLVMVRAGVLDRRDSDGCWVLVFDYDHMLFDHDKISAKTVVFLAQRFAKVMRGGIMQQDKDDLFA